jgi:hypothetical protein
MDISVGAVMLQNELTLLKIIVGVGFLVWMMLMFVQVVWMNQRPITTQISQKDLKKGFDKPQFLKAA